MQFQIRKRATPPRPIQPQFTRISNGKIIASTQWLDDDGQRRERFQVITVREDGKIADIQGCTSRRTAERFARRP